MHTAAELAAANRRLSERLGWTLADLHVGSMNDVADVISPFQGAHGLEEDGKFGPATYSAWIKRELQVLKDNHAPAAEIARCALIRLWLLDVKDPPDRSALWRPDRDLVRGIIRALGPKWLDEANDYTHDGPSSTGKPAFQWCGATFAKGHVDGETGLSVFVRQNFFPSTYRLDAWGRGVPLELDGRDPVIPPKTAVPRLIEDHTQIQRGDVVIVGKKKRYGDHIVFPEGQPDALGLVRTLEGNAVGPGPNGAWREGVVRRTRKLDEVCRVYRIQPEDFGA